MSIKENYFSLSGTIDRMTFVKRSLIMFAVTLVGLPVLLIAGAAGVAVLTMASQSTAMAYTGSILLALVLVIIFGWPAVAVTTQRVRDIGINVWFVVAACVLFGICENLVFSRIPALIAYTPKAGPPVSWLIVIENIVMLVALCALPSGFMGGGDNFDDRSPAERPVSPVGRPPARSQPKPRTSGSVPQFGRAAQFGARTAAIQRR